MKRLSLNRNKTGKKQNDSQQQPRKISSFFFKTPDQASKKDEEGDDMIENTPEAVVAQPGDAEVSKKRKLFKLKAHSSKVGNLFGASTTSLISGNLDKKASKIQDQFVDSSDILFSEVECIILIQTGTVQVNNYEIVVKFVHISHNLT